MVTSDEARRHRAWLTDLQVAARYGIKSRTTPWRWAAKGTFPKPVHIGPGTTRWDSSELDAHDARRAAERS